MNKKYLPVIIIAALLILAMWRTTFESHRVPKIPSIKLVLFIVVDQFPYEYVDRFLPHAESGLTRLFASGRSFTDAHHDHGVTATCPGHAVLATGAYPKTNGIIGNGWYDSKTGDEVYCVEDKRYKRSPRKLSVSGLGDWLKARSSSAKIYAVSGKDRGAIPLAGKRGDAAFWFDSKSGRFATSEYYPRDTRSPHWLEGYFSNSYLLKLFGTPWYPLPTSNDVRKKAGITYLDEGLFPDRFPHKLGDPQMSPSRKFYSDIASSPFLDQYTTDFAKALIENEGLGSDNDIDLLGISYSALDRVGHRYGPHSPEIFDTFLRLDQTIGDLLSFVEKRVGLDNTLIVLSADHGVQPYPEYTKTIGVPEEDDCGYRQSPLDVACMQGVKAHLRDTFGVDLLIADGYLRHEAISSNSLSRSAIDREVQGYLKRCRMIERVWTPSDFKNCRGDDSAICQMYARSYLPGRSPDYTVQPKRNHLHWMIRGTGHGSPYKYDSHVPLVFSHPRIPAGKNSDRISVVHTAPTVADLLALTRPPAGEGRALKLLK